MKPLSVNENNLLGNSPTADDPTLSSSVTPVLLTIVATVLLFVFACGVWASFAQIAGGVQAPGVLSHLGNRIKIQHLEGGIVQQVMVTKGETVEQGQPLLVVAKAESRARLKSVIERRITLSARLARLEAEQTGQKDVRFPNRISDRYPAHRQAIKDQLILFATRSAARDNRQNILKRKSEQLTAEIQGLGAQLESQNEQIAYLEEDISGIELLVANGHARASQLRNLKRQLVVLEGESARSKAAIARINREKSEIDLQLLQLDIDLLSDITNEIDETRAELNDLEREFSSSSDIVKRTTIFAPVSGKILAERLPAVGAVLRSGENVLEIIPTDRSMIIRSRLSPYDVDGVSPGMNALVRMAGLDPRQVPNIRGMVRRISPDTLIDQTTGKAYFDVEIIVDSSDMKRLRDNSQLRSTLVAGMPVDVLVVTESRTMMSYLTAPLVSSTWRAFRE